MSAVHINDFQEALLRPVVVGEFKAVTDIGNVVGRGRKASRNEDFFDAVTGRDMDYGVMVLFVDFEDDIPDGKDIIRPVLYDALFLARYNDTHKSEEATIDRMERAINRFTPRKKLVIPELPELRVTSGPLGRRQGRTILVDQKFQVMGHLWTRRLRVEVKACVR